MGPGYKLYYIGRVNGRPTVSVLEPVEGAEDRFTGECTIGATPHIATPDAPLVLVPAGEGDRRATLNCRQCEATREVMLYLSRERAVKLAQSLMANRLRRGPGREK